MFKYIASPYSHQDLKVQQLRYERVLAFTASALSSGKHVYSPIVHNHPMSLQYTLPCGFDFWRDYNFAMIHRCDELIVLMLDGWKQSKGVAGEINYAKSRGIPVRYVKPPKLQKKPSDMVDSTMLALSSRG